MTPEELSAVIRSALLDAVGAGTLALAPEDIPEVKVERPRQREHGEQTLLKMQWRETQLGGTLAIHPEAPPTLGFISLRAFVVALHYSGCCSLHASFFYI